MKRIIPWLLLILIISSCSRTSNFIKVNYPKDKRSLFTPNDNIYYINLDTNRVSFHQGSTKDINSIAKFDFENFLINKETEIGFYDSFDLVDEKNYGFNSPKEYFVNEYNKTFLRVMQGESLRMTKYAPKKLNIKTLDQIFVEEAFEKKYIYTLKDSLKLIVYEPSDIKKFCEKIKKLQPEANYLIMIGNLYVTKGLFERIQRYQNTNPFSGFTTETYYSSKGVLISPKVIIDLNNSQISGYHIGINIIDPSVIQSIRTGVETAIVNDVMELNLYY